MPLSAALLTGVVLGQWYGGGSLVWGAVGVVLAFALPRAVGSALGALVVGWTCGQVAAPADFETLGLDIERPVTVVGRPAEAWRRTRLGWSVRFRVESIRQGSDVFRWPEEVLLYLPPADQSPVGSVLRASGRLRAPARFGNGVPAPPRRWRLSVKSPRLVTACRGSPEGVGQQLLRMPRRLVARALARPRYRYGAAIGRALVLGDPADLPSSWLISLRRAGLGHLLAVSGLHVGLAMAIVWLACFSLRPRYRLLPCALAVLTYLAVVGPRPSLMRSALMALVALSSFLAERKPMVLNSLSVALAMMVVLSPSVVGRLGFQLTSAATFGLVVLAPGLQRQLGALPNVVASGLAASIAAHVATLPWSLSVFHLWTPGAVGLNLIAVPWMAVTLLLSVAVVTLGWFGVVGEGLWWLLDLAAQPFGWLARMPVRGLGSHGVSVDWPLSLSITALMATAVVWRGNGWFRMALVGVAVSAVLLPGAPSSPPQIVMLDVGQGEAILLRDGASTVLVDGGGGLVPGLAAREVVPALRRLGTRRLAGVVMTHPDLDHCAGLLEISLLLPVESLWATPGWRRTCYRDLILRPGVRFRPVWAGSSWNVGQWSFEVLHPAAGTRLSGNEHSIVLRASLGQFTVLLTGDIGEPGEKELLAENGAALTADVLKLGHHGSRGSTSPQLLRRVSPRLALVSSGMGNAHGHPAAEILRRLASHEVPLMRTDVGGQVVVSVGRAGQFSALQPWAEAKRSPVRLAGRSLAGRLVESADGAGHRHRRADSGRQE